MLVERFRSSSCVVLPKEDSLVIDELDAGSGDDLSAELFTLEKIEEVQAHRIFEEFGEFGLFPVEQIF